MTEQRLEDRAGVHAALRQAVVRQRHLARRGRARVVAAAARQFV